MVNHIEPLPTNRGAALLLTERAAPLLTIESASRAVSQTVPRQTTDPVSFGGLKLNSVGSGDGVLVRGDTMTRVTREPWTIRVH